MVLLLLEEIIVLDRLFLKDNDSKMVVFHTLKYCLKAVGKAQWLQVLFLAKDPSLVPSTKSE